MELLDRYLKAVGKVLPEEQRDDIIRELSEDIRSEVEEKENALQRPLTSAEQEAILKRHGNPLVLAGRYRQDQRSVAFGPQLIGPVLFPFYIKVLSFNLGLTFVVIGTIFAALAIGGQNITLKDILNTILLQLFIQLTAVTFIFAMVQRGITKFPDRWNIGGVHLTVCVDKKATPEQRQVSRFESISIIVASGVALVWLAEVQRHPFLIFGPAAYFLRLAPIWAQMFAPIVLLTALGVVQAGINVFRPSWTGFRTVAQVVIQMASLVVLFFLLKAGVWVTLADSAENAARYTRILQIVNDGVFYGLLIGGVITAVQVALRIARLVRAKHTSGSVPSVDVKY